MNFNDVPPEVTKVAPGAIGAFFSLLWIKEAWPRKVVMFLAGAALSRFGNANVSAWSGLDVGFTGFLLGLFGMSIVAKMFEVWQKFDLGAILSEWLRKILGLAPSPPSSTTPPPAPPPPTKGP